MSKCSLLLLMGFLIGCTACYIMLLRYLHEYGSTFTGGPQRMLPSRSATNSTSTFPEEQFRIATEGLKPGDEYFDIPLSAVRPSRRLLDCDYRLMLGEPTCTTLLYCFVTTVLFAFNYFVSQSISDVRHLRRGTFAGIFASAGATGLIARAVQFDHVRPNWWYTYPVLAHFAALTASFWSVVLLRADLVACLHQLRRDARCRNFTLLPPSDKSALVYPCVCTLAALVVAHLIKTTFAHYELECAGLCWLADSSLYISLHAPVLVFALINLLVLFLTALDLHSSYDGTDRTDRTVQTVYDALRVHFLTFSMLVFFWHQALAACLVGQQTFCQLIITFIITSVFCSFSIDHSDEKFRPIFVTPFTFDLNTLANPYFDPN